jgi:hypothetical protein
MDMRMGVMDGIFTARSAGYLKGYPSFRAVMRGEYYHRGTGKCKTVRIHLAHFVIKIKIHLSKTHIMLHQTTNISIMNKIFL